MSAEQIILKELDGLAAAAEVFLEKYYKAKSKSEGFYSSASRKGRGLSEKEAAKMLTKRKKNINRRKLNS